MSKLGEAVKGIAGILDKQEKQQDEVLKLNRQIIRDCSKAIKEMHSGNLEAAENELKQIRENIALIGSKDAEFKRNSQTCYQEYVEIACLMALFKREELPDYGDLKVEFVPWLLGLADTVGELRRALQLSLRKGKKDDAEYYFGKMNEIYDELMVLKYSSSLVGNLRRKTDVLRGQIEQARSEMLR